jgi:hypothetical protein
MTLTIADAARASGVSAHTLRYHERAGPLDPDAVRSQLAEMERNLELIGHKIDFYRERLTT